MTATMTATRRRPARIASDEAHSWARNLRLRNSLAKLVLSMLTLYVDGDGCCFVGIPALSEDTELSQATVRSRLAWLEQIGAIVRFPQWVDEHGRRNSDARGRRTTDLIRLMTDADAEEIEARAAGLSEDETSADPLRRRGSTAPSHANGEPPTNRPDDAEKTAQDSVSPSVTLQLRAGPDSLNSEPEPIPPNPPSGGGSTGAEVQEIETWPHEASWSQFEKAWQEPILHQTICRQIWTALTDADRERAITVARGYVAWRTTQRKPPNVCNAQKILREKHAWPGYEKLAPVREVARVRVERGTREFAAAAIYVLTTARTPLARDAIEIRQTHLDSPLFMALAKAADVHGIDNRDRWRRLDPELDKPKIAAWRDRIKQWTGLWPELEKVPVLDEFGQPKVNIKEWNGKELKFPVLREGLIVPAEWPPRADGSWPEFERETGEMGDDVGADTDEASVELGHDTPGRVDDGANRQPTAAGADQG